MAEINPLLRNYVYVYTEDSTCRGDCAEQFLDCLGAQITLYRNFGTVCVCGDFNARCGNLQDISLLCDTEIPPHKVLDVEQNSHGKQFIVTTGELVTKAEQKWLACSNRNTRPLLRAEYQQLRQKLTPWLGRLRENVASFPSPRPASLRLQYGTGKLGEGLGTRLEKMVKQDLGVPGFIATGRSTNILEPIKKTYWIGEEEVSQNPNGGH